MTPPSIAAIDSIVKLKQIRERKGFSQRALAAKVKMSQTFLCNLENGKANPSLRTLTRLAKALGITAVDLIK